MKILVTGGAGFIASTVVDEYIREGHEVIVVDNLSTGKIYNINKKAKFYLMDIRSPLLEMVFQNEKPDIVNHHAAQISVPFSVKDPIFDAEINIIGLLNILNNCVKYNIKKIIFISSGGAIYGEATEYPTTEDYIPNPISPYAISKYASENYLHFYNNQYNLNYTILRYSNVYGPRQIPHGEGGVISIFIKNLLSRKTSPVIFAYEENPEGMIRDYVFVKDVAKANILVLNSGDNDFFNICTQKEVTTQALFNEICKIMNVNVIPEKKGPRPGDLKRSCLVNEKANKKLGWKPVTTLYDGIKETHEFFKINRTSVGFKI